MFDFVGLTKLLVLLAVFIGCDLHLVNKKQNLTDEKNHIKTRQGTIS